MRIEILALMGFIFVLNLGGCSQPEPVISTYEPAECACGEVAQPAVVQPAVVQPRAESTQIDKTEPPAAKSLRLEAKPARDAKKKPAKKKPARHTKNSPPAKSEDRPAGVAKSPDAPAEDTRLDLNTATLTELIGLPGVGPSLAGRIVDYRQKRRFTKTAHLMRVKGIGKAKYAKIAHLVGVGAPAPQ